MLKVDACIKQLIQQIEDTSTESKTDTYEAYCQQFVRDVASIKLHDDLALHESEAQTTCSVFQMTEIDVQATTDLAQASVQTNHEAFQVTSETQVDLAYADEAIQHQLPADQEFNKETDATAQTGHDNTTQVELVQEGRGVDSCYSEMCHTTEVQEVPLQEEKDAQASVGLEDKEVHALFCGESREVQCVAEQSECTI